MTFLSIFIGVYANPALAQVVYFRPTPRVVLQGSFALDFATDWMPEAIMLPHTRAIIAAAVYACIRGKKVAGIHDHAAGRDLQIAAECRGQQLQGVDGDRSAKFGGTLPEIYEAGEKAFISLEIDGATAQGYDRGSSDHYTAKVTDQLVQLYDHGLATWFAFGVLEAEPI